jgi:hypothetical protein
LGNLEDGLAQSSINTGISGVGTIQTIQSFANQITNINAGVFIPSGIWDVNIFASAAANGDTTHINLYFALFGRTALGVETQIGTNSSLVSVDMTTVEQLKMTVALPYTDISAYNSLVIKIYGINNRSATTNITTYYEGTTTYSHCHTTFGIYIPPSLLSLNNTWTGSNTFTQVIQSVGLNSTDGLSITSSTGTTVTGPLSIANQLTTTALSISSGVVNINFASKQVAYFSLNITSNITGFTFSNAIQNGTYIVYITVGGTFTVSKTLGHPNTLSGNTSFISGSVWVLQIYYIGSAFRLNFSNYT